MPVNMHWALKYFLDRLTKSSDNCHLSAADGLWNSHIIFLSQGTFHQKN